MFYGPGVRKKESVESQEAYEKRLKEKEAKEKKEKEELFSKITEEDRERVVEYKVFITSDGEEFENNRKGAYEHEKDLKLKSLFNFEASEERLSSFSEDNFDESKFAFLKNTHLENPTRNTHHGSGRPQNRLSTYTQPDFYNSIDSVPKLRGAILKAILASVLPVYNDWRIFIDRIKNKGIYDTHSGFVKPEYIEIDNDVFGSFAYNTQCLVIKKNLPEFINIVSKEEGSILHDIKYALENIALKYVYHKDGFESKKLHGGLKRVHEANIAVDSETAYSMITAILFPREKQLSKYDIDTSDWDNVDEDSLEKNVKHESYYLLDKISKEEKTKYEYKIKYYVFKSDLKKLDDVLLSFYKKDKEGFETLIKETLKNAVRKDRNSFGLASAGMRYSPKEALSFLFKWIEENIPEYKLHSVDRETTMRYFRRFRDFSKMQITPQLAKFLIESLSLSKEDQNTLERQLEMTEIEELILKGALNSNNKSVLEKIKKQIDDKVLELQKQGYAFISEVDEGHTKNSKLFKVLKKERKEDFIRKCVTKGVCYTQNKYHLITADASGVVFKKLEATNDAVSVGQKVKIDLSNIKSVSV